MGSGPNASPIGQQRESAEQARRTRVETAIANPSLFGDVYVAPYDDGWKGPLPRVAREVALFLSLVRRGAVIMPPEYLKSTVLSAYALWLTARYAALGRIAALTGMFFSEEQGLAERNLGVVSWHIENNALLRRDFIDTTGRPLLEPDEDEDKWRDDEIVVRRSGKVKDSTWVAKGLDSKGIQGARVRHLLGDDVITPANAHSQVKQANAVRLWDEQVTTRVLEDGQAVILGNFNNGRDLLSQLARRESYAVLRRPSLYVDGDRAKAPENPTDPRAELQLPEKWSRARLELERREKPNRFKRIHLLDESADVGERLKQSWLTIIPPDDTPVGQCRWIIAVDPAPGGEGDDLDYFNVTVLGLHGSADAAHGDIAISHDSRIPIGEQAELLAMYHDRFDRVGDGVTAIGVSKVALDRYFSGAFAILRPDLKRKLVPIGIGSEQPNAPKLAQSKIARLEALGPQAMSGWLRIWQPAAESLTSAEADQSNELSFVEQWVGFPHIRHDDKLDGADIACRAAGEFGYRGTVRKVKLRAAKR